MRTHIPACTAEPLPWQTLESALSKLPPAAAAGGCRVGKAALVSANPARLGKWLVLRDSDNTKKQMCWSRRGSQKEPGKSTSQTDTGAPRPHGSLELGPHWFPAP